MKYVLLALTLALTACEQDDTAAPSSSTGSTPAPDILTAPTLMLPSNGSTLSETPLLFTWQDVPGAGSYELHAWFHTGPTGTAWFTNQILPDNYHTFYMTITPDLSGDTVYWRVRGRNAAATELGPWSETRSFVLQ